MTYVVDTTIFNWLIDGRISPENLPSDAPFLATHIQTDEISSTPDSERRARLFLKFAEMQPILAATESFVAGVSRAGKAKASSDGLYTAIKDQLPARKRRSRSNAHDALIAEVAIKNGYVLLTADGPLARVAEANGCKVVRFSAP